MLRFNYYYCCRHCAELVSLLERNDIRYRFSGGDITPLCVVFSIRCPVGEVSPVVAELSSAGEYPVISAEYTPAELASAQWIWMTPKQQKIEIVNVEEAYHYSCTRIHPFIGETAKHAEQIGIFTIAKEPATSTKTAFWAEDTGFAEVFADWRVRQLAEKNGLSGVEFRDVMLSKGELSSKLYQMTSAHVLPIKAIACGHGEKALCCPYCGKTGFQVDNAYQLHLYASYLRDNTDMYVTERIFGEGIAHSLYVISQRLYHLLAEQKLTGSVTFSPVVEHQKKAEDNV